MFNIQSIFLIVFYYLENVLNCINYKLYHVPGNDLVIVISVIIKFFNKNTNSNWNFNKLDYVKMSSYNLEDKKL